jgi:hypothetical protein
MFPLRLAFSSLALSTVLASALAVPPADAQAPRPGQVPPVPQSAPPGPRGQAQPPGSPAGQQGQPAPPKPYKQVAVTPPPPSTDPSFEAFRKQIAGIAAKMDRAALARVVVPTNFFWMGEKGDKANKRKSGIDNLAAAIDLDAKDGSGWIGLAHVVGEVSLEPLPQRRGVSCSPASPMFDEKAAEQIAKDTGTDPGEWAYPIKAGIEVHAAAQENSPVIEKLGMHLIRFIPEEPPPGTQPPAMPFLKVVTPSGKVGFVPEETLSTLDFDQICYVKDATGWKIAGYVGDN